MNCLVIENENLSAAHWNSASKEAFAEHAGPSGQKCQPTSIQSASEAEEVLALPPLEPAVLLEVSAAWELDAAAVCPEGPESREDLKEFAAEMVR